MKYISTLILTTTFLGSSFAQSVPIDFEPCGTGANWNWNTFENDSNAPIQFVGNPNADALNPSAVVAKMITLQAGAPFAGVESQHGSDIGSFALDSTNSMIRIMVYKDRISDVGIKLVETNNASLGEIKKANTKINEWEELVFDFSSMEGITYDQIVVFPDFYARPQDNTVYFDNISFGPQATLVGPLVSAVAPTIANLSVYSLFSEAYIAQTVDSWLAQGSVAGYANSAIQGNAVKYYCDADSAIIDLSNNQVDATNMVDMYLDVWSPDFTDFSITLIDFGPDGVAGGNDDSQHSVSYNSLAQNSWNTVRPSMSDFTGLVGKSNIGQIILKTEPATADITIDNLYFSQVSPNGIGEIQPSAPAVYPNPTRDILHIQADGTIQSVSVFDVTGKLVLGSKVSNQIGLSDLTEGSYSVVVTVNGAVYTSRVFKL